MKSKIIFFLWLKLVYLVLRIQLIKKKKKITSLSPGNLVFEFTPDRRRSDGPNISLRNNIRYVVHNGAQNVYVTDYVNNNI